MKHDADIAGIVRKIEKKTLAAKLREAMPEIERKLDDGVKQNEIVDALRKEGIDVSLPMFRGVLYRYRQQQGRVKRRKPGNPENPKTPAKAQAEKPKPKTEGGVKLDPNLVDKILSEHNDY